MNSKDSSRIAESISTSIVIAGTRAISFLSDAKRFREFLKKKSVKKTDLLPGMKLAFKSIMESQIMQAESLGSFDFEDDRITRRALYVGIPISEVRSNCQRAKVLRGLEIATDRVLNEATIPDFHAAIAEELNPWIEAVAEMFNLYVRTNEGVSDDLSKEDVRNHLTFSWLLRFLDARRQTGVPLKSSPMGQRVLETTEGRERRNNLDRSFAGWKTVTAYLWSSIHDDSLPSSPEDSVLRCQSWEDLDNLFRPIADDPIEIVDRRLGTSMNDVFLKTADCAPNSLKPLEIEVETGEWKSTKEFLDHKFLWYRFEVLDGAHPKIFPGVSTFINLLIGTVKLKKIYDRPNPVEVRRIKHPSPTGREHYDISYAVLVPSFSSMADYSGWLVSLYCCNNYSGFSGGMRNQAEYFIESNKKYLSIDEMKVDIDEFREYLRTKVKERGETQFGYLSRSELESLELEESIKLGTEMSAVLMELFMGVIMAEEGYRIYWQYRNKSVIGKKEIDILALDVNEVQIIECSRTLPMRNREVSEIVQELNRKKTLIANSQFSRPEIKIRYITTANIDREPLRSTASELRKEGIQVESVFEVLEQSQHRKKPVQELLLQINRMKAMWRM